jgi:ABC-2 type transport system ATP-binding protein
MPPDAFVKRRTRRTHFDVLRGSRTLSDTAAVIQVRDLQKRYGTVHAVDGVSFEVRPCEVFGLLGPNGAGKTTTVEILEGLRRPDAGEVRVLGIDATRDPAAIKERTGVQLQTAALYPNLTVSETVELFRSFYAHSRPATELIDALDLRDRATALTRVLSGGQRQRLSVALALVNDPELLFLDEPTTGLDPQARRSLWDLVGRLRAQGKTILLTTHYMEEAERLCDRIAIMDHGRILEMGTVSELVSRRFSERTVRFQSVDGLDERDLAGLSGVRRHATEDGHVVLYTVDVPATIADLLRATAAIGSEPANLSVRQASLEDVFLDLTGRALRD